MLSQRSLASTMQQAFNSAIAGLIGLVLIGGAVYESIHSGSVEPALLVMATAVTSVYFTGQSNKQVNGEKVDALTQSVMALHARMDSKDTPA